MAKPEETKAPEGENAQIVKHIEKIIESLHIHANQVSEFPSVSVTPDNQVTITFSTFNPDTNPAGDEFIENVQRAFASFNPKTRGHRNETQIMRELAKKSLAHPALGTDKDTMARSAAVQFLSGTKSEPHIDPTTTPATITFNLGTGNYNEKLDGTALSAKRIAVANALRPLERLLDLSKPDERGELAAALRDSLGLTPDKMQEGLDYITSRYMEAGVRGPAIDPMDYKAQEELRRRIGPGGGIRL